MNNKKQLILIVDDVPENIQVLLRILNPQGHEFSIATNGKETFAAIESEVPDLILLDIMLPDIDGFEICTRLKSKPETANIPIIFLTAKVEIDDKITGFKLGAVDYITKPFEEEEVIARVKTHLKLKQTESELRALNATKDRLFSIIAHDLRGPIGNIDNALKLIQQGFFDQKETDDLIVNLSKTAQSTHELLENLLNWARTQKEDIESSPSAINIKDIIETNVYLLTNTAQNKEIKLTNFATKDFTIFADENMINAVVRNLISNALKFTKNGGEVKIESLLMKEAGKDFTKVSIIDNGVGISSENSLLLFDKFEHVTTYGTNYEKGSGLGLMICKEFVEKNGGRIWFTSKLNEGSVFNFTIPVKQ